MSEKTRKIIKWMGLGILTIGIGVASGATFYIYRQVHAFDKIFMHGISIDKVDIGGLTKEEAIQALTQKLDVQLEEVKITIASDEENTALSLKELGVQYLPEEAVTKVFEQVHEGNVFERYERYYKGRQKQVDYPVAYLYQIEAIEKALQAYEELFFKEPIEATITRADKQFVITKEQSGESMDVKETAKSIEKRIEEKAFDQPVYIATKKIEPTHTADALKKIQTPISSFATYYNNADLLRNENLKVASLKINEVLTPGEVFSLAEHLEPITYEEGYRASKVIVAGRLEDGIGGGVCQVASTLYNAVLLSNLSIVQRQNHSLPVGYVQLGRDATYASGVIDFKFQNNSEYPIFIESYCENNQVYVNIFGHESVKLPYDEIKFASETVETIAPPQTKYIDDPTLEIGTEKEELKALYGYKVELYRLYYSNGKLVEKEYLDLSYYRPRAAIIRRGTKPVKNNMQEMTNEDIKEIETTLDEEDLNEYDLNQYDPNQYDPSEDNGVNP